MNNAVKIIIFLQSLLLVGCGSQNLVIETYIPKPLVKKYESITANLTFDEEIKSFIFTPEQLQKREASVEINFGSTQAELFENIFSSFISINAVEKNSDESSKLILIDIKLDKFEYLTPQMAANQKYSVWFKYSIQIQDENERAIDDWVITGYGEQDTGVFSADEAFKRAIQIALRDTGANLSIKAQDELDKIADMIG
tara:strand:- start:3438 stop:4031 length:594 start_codon:yes stop_codon:yes gene_type:complete